MVTGPTWAKQETVLPLRRTAVKRYVTQILIVTTFHTVLNGTTVNCAPSAISQPPEMQENTHLGRRSTKVSCDKRAQEKGLSNLIPCWKIGEISVHYVILF